ncbi:MAG: hypothetical protein U1F53_06860 [Burkholderiaceae bacterium]
MRHHLAAALAVLLAAAGPAAHAAPRTPTDDHEVIERLPARLPGAGPRRTAAAQRLALHEASSANLPLALALARQAIEQARASGDPRDWGQAQAALAPWWAADAPPAAVRLLRATIRQGQHDFAAALADLDAVLAAAPREAPASLRRAAWHGRGSADDALALRAQAELTRASIHQVQGRYALAREGCERLAGPGYAALGESAQVPAKAYLAELGQLQGRLGAREADARLAALGPAGDPWLALLRAELAQRSGLPGAEALFRAATAGAQPGLYALAARADWLLDQGRPREAATLLAGRDAADALMLRRVIAERRLLGARVGPAGVPPALRRDVADLQARFEAALVRGDRSHAREQARFMLDVLGDAAAALPLAQANWAWQREPADALLLLRAAAAAGQPAAAAPARQWATGQGFGDVRWPRLPAGNATTLQRSTT